MKRYAVILGCEEYDNKNSYPDISFCHNDVELIKDTLINYCDFAEQNVYYEFLSPYMKENPSDILNKIEEFINNSEEGDTILFYYAGHGECYNEEAYLILPHTDPNNLEQTALPLRDVSSKMKLNKRINVRVFDACNSGYDTRGRKTNLDNNFINEVMSGKNDGWVTFASCRGDEYSYPDSSLQHGVFTYYFAKSIREYPENEFIYPERLKIDVCRMVSDWCNENKRSQTPTYNAAISGNITIGRRKKIVSTVNNKSNENKDKSIMERINNVKSYKRVDNEDNIKLLTEYINYIYNQFKSNDAKFDSYGNEVNILEVSSISDIPENIKSVIAKFIQNRDLKTLHYLKVEKIYEEENRSILKKSLLDSLWNTNKINNERKIKEVRYELEEGYRLPNSYINIEISSDGYLDNASIFIYLCPLQLRSAIISGIIIETKNPRIHLVEPVYLKMSEEDDKKQIDVFISKSIVFFNKIYEKSVRNCIEYYEKELLL